MAELTEEQLFAARMGLAALGMQNFCKSLIMHGRRGGKFDADGLAAIREGTINAAKNTTSDNLSLEQDAEIVGKTVRDLEQLIDRCIVEGCEQTPPGR